VNRTSVARVSDKAPIFSAAPRLTRFIVTLVVLAAAFLFCAPSSAWAWGCEGHQIVALIAERHVTPRALAMVKQILLDGPIDPSLSRYCKEGSTDPLADASTWADDIRALRPQTAPWHYIDIPLGASSRELAKFCPLPESCVTQVITDQLVVLRSPGIDPQKKADALRFLIHFVGDVHQPLHAATNNDQGGNCVPVAYFDALPQLRNPEAESYAPNLHGVWDVNILARMTMGKTPEQVASELDQSFRSRIVRWKEGSADMNGWAGESYQLAEKKVYGKLPVRVPVESPQHVQSCADDNHVSARLLKLNERLQQPYQNVAAQVVQQQIAKAGARLALLLNQLWP
jgi:S1/P1 Nuclease